MNNKGAYVTSNEAYICLVAAAVVGAASAFLAPKAPKIFNWGAPVAAIAWVLYLAVGFMGIGNEE